MYNFIKLSNTLPINVKSTDKGILATKSASEWKITKPRLFKSPMLPGVDVILSKKNVAETEVPKPGIRKIFLKTYTNVCEETEN